MVVATASSPRNRPGGGTAITVDGDLPSLARGPGWAPFYGQMSKMSEPIDMPDIGGLIRPAPDEARGDRECAVRGPQCAGGLDSKLSEPLQLIKDSGCHVSLSTLKADSIDAWPLNNAYGAVVNLMGPAHVEAVFIAGHVRKWRGHLVGVDMRHVLRSMQEARDGVLRRANFPNNLFG